MSFLHFGISDSQFPHRSAQPTVGKWYKFACQSWTPPLWLNLLIMEISLKLVYLVLNAGLAKSLSVIFFRNLGNRWYVWDQREANIDSFVCNFFFFFLHLLSIMSICYYFSFVTVFIHTKENKRNIIKTYKEREIERERERERERGTVYCECCSLRYCLPIKTLEE